MFTQNFYTNIYSSLIFNSQKCKQPTCPSIIRWLNKWAHSHHGLLFNSEMDWTVGTHNHLDEGPENFVGSKQPIQKLHTQWFPLRNILKIANIRNVKQTNGFQRLRKGREQEEAGASLRQPDGPCGSVAVFPLYVILEFADDYHWGNWVKDKWCLLVLLLTTALEAIIISK